MQNLRFLVLVFLAESVKSSSRLQKCPSHVKTGFSNRHNVPNDFWQSNHVKIVFFQQVKVNFSFPFGIHWLRNSLTTVIFFLTPYCESYQSYRLFIFFFSSSGETLLSQENSNNCHYTFIVAAEGQNACIRNVENNPLISSGSNSKSKNSDNASPSEYSNDNQNPRRKRSKKVRRTSRSARIREVTKRVEEIASATETYF